MIERRTFVIGLGVGLITIPRTVRSQPRKSARIGWVGRWYSQPAASSLFDAFRQGMRELGYVEGQNLTIEARWLEGIASPHEEAAKATNPLWQERIATAETRGMEPLVEPTIGRWFTAPFCGSIPSAP